MACIGKIVKDIVSTCATQTIGGIENTVYLINRSDIALIERDSINESLVTGITLATATPALKAYKLVGIKKGLNYSFERVVAEDQADRFKHKLTFSVFESDSASVENADELSDLVAIVERKEKGVLDGTFVALGLGTGLYVTSDTASANDANGVRKIEMTTMDGQLERYSQNNVLDTDYATTKAMLEGLL